VGRALQRALPLDSAFAKYRISDLVLARVEESLENYYFVIPRMRTSWFKQLWMPAYAGMTVVQ
jgi:hypothetical protein